MYFYLCPRLCVCVRKIFSCFCPVSVNDLPVSVCMRLFAHVSICRYVRYVSLYVYVSKCECICLCLDVSVCEWSLFVNVSVYAAYFFECARMYRVCVCICARALVRVMCVLCVCICVVLFCEGMWWMYV